MNTRRRRLGGDVCAIFVHAGAGYHSVQNERIHLQACEHAARAAMNVLSEGSGAVDAVEVAIRVLEDKEITNAGYGSNLSLDGTVECDATIVDHYGRSGAVGAVGRKLPLLSHGGTAFRSSSPQRFNIQSTWPASSSTTPPSPCHCVVSRPIFSPVPGPPTSLNPSICPSCPLTLLCLILLETVG
ncbi:MAG: hypothetical protein Q9186_002270 [Xanthomendoza sp. 1 TL-2023]